MCKRWTETHAPKCHLCTSDTSCQEEQRTPPATNGSLIPLRKASCPKGTCPSPVSITPQWAAWRSGSWQGRSWEGRASCRNRPTRLLSCAASTRSCTPAKSNVAYQQWCLILSLHDTGHADCRLWVWLPQCGLHASQCAASPHVHATAVRVAQYQGQWQGSRGRA